MGKYVILQLEWKKTQVVSLTRARTEEYVALSMVLPSAHAQKDIYRLSAKSVVAQLALQILVKMLVAVSQLGKDMIVFVISGILDQTAKLIDVKNVTQSMLCATLDNVLVNLDILEMVISV